MTIDQFWNIIAQCSPHSFDMDLKCRLLKEHLIKLTPEDLRSFADHYWDLRDSAYQWPLWDAAAISHNGCGDDSFMDYRSSLVTFGRSIFENALSNPDSLGALDQPVPCYDDVYTVIHDVVEDVLGSDYRPSTSEKERPTGRSIEDENPDAPESLARIRFPKIYEQQNRISQLSAKKPWWKLW